MCGWSPSPAQAGSAKHAWRRKIARAVAPVFRDGVRFVPLESITDPELAKLALAQAVGVPRSVDDLESAIVEVLADQHTPLVIDNLEQVVSGGALLCAAVDGGTRRQDADDQSPPYACRASTSSRHRHLRSGWQIARSFGVRPAFGRGSAVYRQGTGRQSARAYRPDVMAGVSRICERLDRFPLAIELAAARSGPAQAGGHSPAARAPSASADLRRP